MSSRRPPIAARRNACRIARCSNCRNRSTSRFSKATQSAMPGSTGSSALSTIGWATRPEVTDVATGRPIGVRSRPETAQAGPRRTETPGSAPRRVLRQDALKGAPVHLEAARGLRHVALAQLEDALDVLPAHAVGGHRVFGRLRRLAFRGEQRALDRVGVGGLGQVVDRPGFHRRDRGRDIAIAGQHDDARAGPGLAQGADDLEPAAVAQPQIDDREGGRGGGRRGDPAGAAVGGLDDKAAPLHRPREPLHQRLARAMERRGFVVQTADSVASGIAAATAAPAAFAVVDLRLSDGSGLEVVSALREARPGARIVMLTGYGNIATAVAILP